MQVQDYRVSIQGRHITVTDAIRKHIETCANRLERVADHILDVHVIVEVQKNAHTAEIVMHVNHFKVVAHATESDLYPAIDKAFDRLHSQLARYKERIKAHQAKGHALGELDVHVFERNELEEINAAIDQENAQREKARFATPKIARKETRPLKVLTVQEAMMKLDLSQEPFIIYRSEEDRKVRVMYVMKDGNFGIITPQE